MEHRFSRTELLIGEQGLDLLSKSSVAVFGLGGVGSYTAEALARAGIGGMFLIDFDTVSISNINRQLHALDNTIGQLKTELMAERVKSINPDIEVKVLEKRYAPGDDYILGWNLDYVVDAIDDVVGKVELIKTCVQRGINIVSSMGAGNKLDPTAFKIGDISETSVCPLARTIRRRLRKEGINSGVTVVYSTEQPGSPRCEQNMPRQSPGSISFVPSVAGLILAGAVVNGLLAGKNGFSGK